MSETKDSMKKIWGNFTGFYRDKVTRLQLFSIFAVITSFGAIVLGAATYATIGIPCSGNRVENIQYDIFDGTKSQKFRPALDPCQLLVNFLLPIATLIVSTIGTIAACLNRKKFYQTFGFLSFLALLVTMVSFVGSISVITDHSDKLNRVSLILSTITTVLNGVALILVFFNLNTAWYIFTAFLKQDREVFEEKRRMEFESRKSEKGELALATLQLANLFGAFAPARDSAKNV